jgi:hypothetical protein
LIMMDTPQPQHHRGGGEVWRVAIGKKADHMQMQLQAFLVQLNSTSRSGSNKLI